MILNGSVVICIALLGIALVWYALECSITRFHDCFYCAGVITDWLANTRLAFA